MQILVVVRANAPTYFQYTSYPAQQYDARSLIVQQGDTVSWLVFSAAGHLVGYKISFDNGTPFANSTVIMPSGGISPPQTVLTVSGTGFKYKIVSSDLSEDDPQVVPVDGFFLGGFDGKIVTVTPPILVGVTAGATTVTPTAAGAKTGSVVYWTDDTSMPPLSYQVDFSASGHGSPFVANPPLLSSQGGQTVAQKVRPLTHGENPNFNYVATAAGATPLQAMFTIG